ncbi:MAG TPA: TIGR03557 family F420-dependent LLM class oxidoreductase [Terriglobales bacterium]|nr:TIGR03557 family F420-dependent LLM class oxidoreductase [Terriglobales bacterium]
MQDLSSNVNGVYEENLSFMLDRRTMLKSAGAVPGATLMTNSIASASGGGELRQTAESTNRSTSPLRKSLIGFQLSFEQFPVPQLLELGIACEEAGFDVITFSDHLQPWQANEGHAGQAWLTMGAIGQRTRRIWMGTTVTCPTFRYNPAVVAEAFASLSLLTPGRIFLGIGSGEALNEEAAVGSWPNWPERSERLVEATDIIRQLWTGQQISHKGKYYQVNMKLYDPPAKPIPLLMAGNGPKAMRRVGQYADGLITDSKTWKQHKVEFESGARDSGKDPSQMPVFVETYVVVGEKKEAEQAAQLWRFGPKAWDPFYNVRDPQVVEQRANAEVPLEKVTEGWPIGTDPAVHVKAITELFESGATEVHIHSGQADQKRVIEFYGREVIPRLRKTSAAA